MLDNGFKPLSFWSFNEKMEILEVERQISEFKKRGYGGFFMHARAVLQIDYMGKEWFDVCKAAIKKAEELDLEVWLYDENGWPSGFANGRVPACGDDFVAKHIYFSQGCPGNIADIIGAYAKCGNKYQFVTDIEKADLFCCIGRLAGYTDLLNAKSVGAFIKYTHEEYKKELGEYFGNVIKGIFTDEPQTVGKYPYTNALPEEFYKEYQINFVENAWMLNSELPETMPFKYKVCKLFAKMFSENFTYQIENWCNNNNLIFTGHFSNEDGLCYQTKVNFNLLEHYRNMSRPGIDFLGRRLTSPVLTKQVADSAYLYDKKMVTSESFGCAGWDVSFDDLSLIYSWQAVFGVNSIVTHLSAYSIKGRRKRDYPAFYSYQEPWWETFEVLSEDINRINTFVSEGKRKPKVLLLHPATGMWCLSGGKNLFSDKMMDFSNQFRMLVEALVDIGHDFVIISENDFSKFDYIKEKFVFNDKEFDRVIVPQTVSLDDSTYQLLQKITDNSKLVFINEKPMLCEGETSLLSEKLCGTVVQNRRDMIEKFFLHTHFSDDIEICSENSKSAHGIVVSKKYMSNGEDRVCIVNPSLTDSKELYIKVKGKKSILSVSSSKENLLETCFDGVNTYAKIKLSPKMTGLYKTILDEKTSQEKILLNEYPLLDADIDLTDNNALTVEKCDVFVNGEELFSNVNIIDVTDAIYEKAYKSKSVCDVLIRYNFTVKFNGEIPDDICLIAETEDMKSVCINGKVIDINSDYWWKDKSFKKYPICNFVENGNNAVDISFQIIPPENICESGNFEGFNNKFFYPAEPENIYITGSFDVICNNILETPEYISVDAPFLITDFSKKKNDEFTKQNLWFYSGNYKISTEFKGNADRNTVLRFENSRFTCADIFLNGLKIGNVFKAPFSIELDNVKNGKNELEIIVYGNNRNLLGPHHHIKGNPHFVGTDTFKGKASWSDFIYPDLVDDSTYTEKYSFVKCSTGKIIISEFV